MANQKLILDDDFTEDFSLIAIHCGEEPYKVAFLLNKFVKLRLSRKQLDLDFSKNGLEITFPMYEFDDEFQFKKYNLVVNKCVSHEAYISSSGGLFDEIASEKTITTYILPEFKRVDYLLKINEETESFFLENLISEINSIQQVVKAYKIEMENIKSIKNLIFE